METSLIKSINLSKGADMDEGFYWFKWKPDELERLTEIPKIKPELLFRGWSIMFYSINGLMLLLGVSGPHDAMHSKQILKKMIIGSKINEPSKGGTDAH